MTLLVDNLVQTAVWKDNFPYSQLHRLEYEKWLQFIKDKGWWDVYLPRLTKMSINKREEAFAEIISMYFLGKIKSFVVKELEPKGKNDKKGDFILDVGTKDIFCEVKSPGWESEIVKKEGLASPRLKAGKYDSIRAEWGTDSESIRQAINKAYAKLPDNDPGLLIIHDDFWRPLFDPTIFQITINEALYRPEPYRDSPPGYFTVDKYKKLSGVLFLQVIKAKNNQIEYQNWLCLNRFASLQFPIALINCLNVIIVPSYKVSPNRTSQITS